MAVEQLVLLTRSAMLWRCRSTCRLLHVSFSSLRNCCTTSAISCLNCCCCGILRALDWLHSRQCLAVFRSRVKWNPVLWRNLSQRGCVGESLTSAEDKCALYMGEVYIQIDQERESLCVWAKEETGERGRQGRGVWVCGCVVWVCGCVVWW